MLTNNIINQPTNIGNSYNEDEKGIDVDQELKDGENTAASNTKIYVH